MNPKISASTLVNMQADGPNNAYIYGRESDKKKIKLLRENGFIPIWPGPNMLVMAKNTGIKTIFSAPFNGWKRLSYMATFEGNRLRTAEEEKEMKPLVTQYINKNDCIIMVDNNHLKNYL